MGRIKSISRFVGLVMCCLFLCGLYVSAANFKRPYIVEQALTKAPDVTAIITGQKMNKKATVKGAIEDITLTTEGKVRKFKETKQGIHYIILFDNSGSVNQQQYEKVKAELVDLRKELRKVDKMELYTVGTNSSTGEKTDVFGRVVKGSDGKRTEQDVAAIQGIEYLRSASAKTVLYRSLNEVLAKETNPTLRTVMILITDGEDDSEGKDIDSVSTKDQVAEASIPVYGILLNNKAKIQNADKMAYTRNEILSEKNCRGFYSDCSTSSSTDSIPESFDTIHEILFNESYVVTMKAPNNKTKGKTTLSLTINNTAIDPTPIQYSDYIADADAPVLAGDIKKTGENSITFVLEDANGIDEASAASVTNYKVTTKGGNLDGKAWAIKTINTNTETGQTTVSMVFENSFYNGDYTLAINNVSDNSQDQNKLKTNVEFTVTDGVSPNTGGKNKNTISTFSLLIIIILAAVLLAGVILYYRRKQAKAAQEEEEEKKPVDSKLIRLRVTDRAGMIKDIDWNVEGSLFIGRSQINNINFDDDMLTKQHFVIEVSKMGCYITDLESTNGTFVNGIRVSGRRMLLDGDVITAGREKFEFTIPK